MSTEFTIGIITAATLLLGAVVAIIKIRPENTRAIVAASTELNTSHREWMMMLEKQAERLRASNEHRGQLLEQLRIELEVAKGEIGRLRTEHAAEIGRIVAEHEADLEQIAMLRVQVASLREEVQALRDQIGG